MLKVAFVYVPIVHRSFEENLRVVDEDFGRLPPLSLAYAAAISEKAGHRTIIVDANGLGLSLEETRRALEAFRPDVLAFTVSTYMFEETTRWMEALRGALRVPTIAGGPNLRLYPRETVQHPGVDHGVLHYATRGLPALLEALEAGRTPAGLSEVVTKLPSGEVVVGPLDPALDPYAELPEPARHLLPNSIYYSIISQRRSFTVMVTGTGCPYSCRYCAITSVPRFRNPVDRVLSEVRSCVERFDIHEIDFFDADFFAHRKRAEELCTRLAEARLDLEWSCRARLDGLSPSVLALARRAGCRKIYVGIESPNETALRAMGRKTDLARVERTLLDMRAAGIRPLGFFMLGVPGETHRSALATIRYALRLPLDYAQFSRMIAKPGSALHRDLVSATGGDTWQAHVLGGPLPARLPNLESRIGEDAIELYTKLAYVAFYYRPSFILRSLAKMRSLDELRRSARTAARMLFGLGGRDGR